MFSIMSSTLNAAYRMSIPNTISCYSIFSTFTRCDFFYIFEFLIPDYLNTLESLERMELYVQQEGGDISLICFRIADAMSFT